MLPCRVPSLLGHVSLAHPHGCSSLSEVKESQGKHSNSKMWRAFFPIQTLSTLTPSTLSLPLMEARKHLKAGPTKGVDSLLVPLIIEATSLGLTGRPEVLYPGGVGESHMTLRADAIIWLGS